MNTTRRSSVRLTTAASRRRQKPEPEPAAKKFIKMIQLSTIKEKMMRIPERFVRLGPKLSDSDTVTIQTPAGFKRSIRIKRNGDEVWFENGWSEFAEAHSLSVGHSLYFHYQGNSSFLVVIFDYTASEIVYPLDKVHVIESDDDEDVVEVMDDDDEDVNEVMDDDDEDVVEVMDDDEEEEGFTRVESSGSSDDDSSEGVTDLEEMLKKKPRVNLKSEKIIIDLC